jgi:hypothetical protein
VLARANSVGTVAATAGLVQLPVAVMLIVALPRGAGDGQPAIS